MDVQSQPGRTARTVETAARQRDALVALGTLSAGLAHELNNPAAAAARAVEALSVSGERLLDTVGALADTDISAAQMRGLDDLRRELRPPATPADPFTLADLEEELTDWLDDHGVADGWRVAGTLAATGADVAWCDRVETALGGPAVGAGLAWVTSTLDVRGQLAEVKESTRRISDLVGAIKGYSQLDRASVQETVLSEGLESTVVVLRHRIPAGVTLVRDYAPDTPAIEAVPAELNQVWTNLITNALDAVEGSGTVRLSMRADADGDGVVVEVANTGTWDDADSRQRAFEPFFTTKGVGQGTGLGLDISRRIVVGRHGGDIGIDVRAGETVLRVWLPRRHVEA